MNKKLNGAAAPKHYESPALAILDVNLENGYASGGNIGDYKQEQMSFGDAYGYYEELY